MAAVSILQELKAGLPKGQVLKLQPLLLCLKDLAGTAGEYSAICHSGRIKRVSSSFPLPPPILFYFYLMEYHFELTI